MDAQETRPKVMQVITSSEIGGAQKLVLQLARTLRDSWEVLVACGGDGELARSLRDAGIRVVNLKYMQRRPHLVRDFAAFFELLSAIKKERPQAVHCHSSKAGFLGRLAAKAAGVPVVVYTSHGWGFAAVRSRLARRIFIWLERLAARWTNVLVCVSESDRRLALESGIAPPDKIKVIRNGLEFAPLIPRKEAREKLGIPEDRKVVGAVGRLAYPKDPKGFIKVAEKLTTRFPNVEPLFVWIGDGPLCQDCLREVRQKGLERWVIFPGEVAEAASFMKAFDVFLHVSKHEGMPLVILEAMAAGVPVVASSVGGIGEVIEDGKEGYLFLPDDLERAAEKVYYCLGDTDLREEMGRRAEEKVKQFRMKETNVCYEKIYALQMEKS